MCRNVFARIYEQLDWPYIEVLNWEWSTSSAHCKAIIFPGVMIVCSPIVAPLFVAQQSSGRCPPPSCYSTFGFSREHMIYDFVILEGLEVTLPTFPPRFTEPHWKLPFTGTRTDRGALSVELSNETATYFIVKARIIHRLTIPHNENEALHFQLMMAF